MHAELAEKGIVDHRVLSNHTVNPRATASEGTKDRVANNGFPRVASKRRGTPFISPHLSKANRTSQRLLFGFTMLGASDRLRF